MGKSSMIAALALSCLSTAAHAAPARSPFLGKWTLDPASMAIPPEARPASVTVEFADAGGGRWRTRYVIVAKDGATRKMTSSEGLNGQATAIEGDQTEADSVAMTSPAPGVLIMNLANNGRPGSVRVYTLSADRTAMTESAASVGGDGKPQIRTFHWRRSSVK